MQDSLYMWDDLMCTRGALNPEKCFWYQVDYECGEGEWKYKPTIGWEMMVLAPGGPYALIKQKDVHPCEETLDMWGCPAGTENR